MLFSASLVPKWGGYSSNARLTAADCEDFPASAWPGVAVECAVLDLAVGRRLDRLRALTPRQVGKAARLLEGLPVPTAPR